MPMLMKLTGLNNCLNNYGLLKYIMKNSFLCFRKKVSFVAYVSLCWLFDRFYNYLSFFFIVSARYVNNFWIQKNSTKTTDHLIPLYLWLKFVNKLGPFIYFFVSLAFKLLIIFGGYLVGFHWQTSPFSRLEASKLLHFWSLLVIFKQQPFIARVLTLLVHEVNHMGIHRLMFWRA